MADAAIDAAQIEAELNFAANRSEDGIWSNTAPELRTQQLASVPVPFTDARTLNPPPSVDREGFELHRMPVVDPQWYDEAWIKEAYVPASLDFVARISGAPHVAPFQHGVTLIRDTSGKGFSPAADFVHLDQSRDSMQVFLDLAADAETQARYPRVRLYNLWRVLTPPPQDVPLALCDQRTVEEEDWVIGNTVEPAAPRKYPYTTCLHNPAQRWHYYPDVTPDDVIVFQQYDSAEGAPLGCLHGAFRMPGELPGTVPRVSIELRVFGFFEA